MRKSRWPSWAPAPKKPTVSVDVKQHSTNHQLTRTQAVCGYTLIKQGEASPAFPGVLSEPSFVGNLIIIRTKMLANEPSFVRNRIIVRIKMLPNEPSFVRNRIIFRI